MQVYLVQHGLAKSKEEDPARPLTAAGREEVERVARAAAAAGVRPASILHSGKLRAGQTAEIFAAHTKSAEGAHAVEGLDPLARGSGWRRRTRPSCWLGTCRTWAVSPHCC